MSTISPSHHSPTQNLGRPREIIQDTPYHRGECLTPQSSEKQEPKRRDRP